MQFFELVGIAASFLIILCIGYLIGKFVSKKEHEEKVPEIREDAIKQSRAVLGGQFSEQISPYLPGFPYKPTEARFIGKPVDFIIFKGMDERNIHEIVFVEVKSGQNKLNDAQKSIKLAVESKKISWHEYKVPEEIMKKRQIPS